MRIMCACGVMAMAFGCSDLVVDYGDKPKESDSGWRFDAPGTGSTDTEPDTDTAEGADTGTDSGSDSGVDTEDECVPTGVEIYYNGLDDDCDTATNDLDADADGHVLSDDCDDGDAAVNPGMTELCDGSDIDEDCDGLANNDDPDVPREFEVFADDDGDGFGDPNNSAMACPDGDPRWVGDNTDCDDTDATVNPDAAEVDEDGVDNDCNGVMTDDICVFHDTGEAADVTMFNRNTWTGSWTDTWASGTTPVCAIYEDIQVGHVYQFNGTDSSGDYLVSGTVNRISAVWVGDYVQTVGNSSGYDCVRTNDGYGIDDWCTVAFYQ